MEDCHNKVQQGAFLCAAIPKEINIYFKNPLKQKIPSLDNPITLRKLLSTAEMVRVAMIMYYKKNLANDKEDIYITLNNPNAHQLNPKKGLASCKLLGT